MKKIFLGILSVFIMGCGAKNIQDNLFSGNLVPINSEEIKKTLGEKND